MMSAKPENALPSLHETSLILSSKSSIKFDLAISENFHLFSTLALTMIHAITDQFLCNLFDERTKPTKSVSMNRVLFLRF